jgi:uncharacterized protein (DUF302 family)
MKKSLLAALLLCIALPVWAGSPAIYEKQIKGDLDKNYDKLNKSLEDSGFFVIFEPNIGKNLDGMAKEMGKEYNLNKLDGIRSMIFCNARYANRLSNLDPSALALCPLHVTLIQKAGITTVLFVKPSAVVQSGSAAPLALEIEATVEKSIEAAAQPAETKP